MAAAKFLDALARFDGNDGEDADATQAYTQAKLKGTPTWIRFPRDQLPKHALITSPR